MARGLDPLVACRGPAPGSWSFRKDGPLLGDAAASDTLSWSPSEVAYGSAARVGRSALSWSPIPYSAGSAWVTDWVYSKAVEVLLTRSGYVVFDGPALVRHFAELAFRSSSFESGDIDLLARAEAEYRGMSGSGILVLPGIGSMLADFSKNLAIMLERIRQWVLRQHFDRLLNEEAFRSICRRAAEKLTSRLVEVRRPVTESRSVNPLHSPHFVCLPIRGPSSGRTTSSLFLRELAP